MNKKILTIALALLLLASSALAETNREACEARYPGETLTARLQQVICVNALEIHDLQNKIAAGEKGQEKRMKELTEALNATQEEFSYMQRNQVEGGGSNKTPSSAGSTDAQQSANAARLAAIQARMADGKTETKSESPTLSAKLQPLPSPPPGVIVSKMMAGGVPYKIRDAPGQQVATTFDLDFDRLEMAHLTWGKKKWKRGAVNVRILVRKNGVILDIAHEDPSAPWNAIYATLKGRGEPRRKAYRAVDPDEVDSIFIPQVGPEDRIELIYLVDTGKRITVPNVPEQIVWGYPTRVVYDRIREKVPLSLESYGGSKL